MANQNRYKQAIKKAISNRRWLYCGSNDTRWIALTFDDGPHPSRTDRCLDILKRSKVRATFFLVGECVGNTPKVAKRIVSEGHEIGSHNYVHKSLKMASMQEISYQIRKNEEEILKATGISTKIFRPPHGITNINYLLYALWHGISTVMWSCEIKDLRQKTGGYHFKGGDIILMHDDEEEDIECLPWLIELIQDQGFQFVTIGDMLRN